MKKILTIGMLLFFACITVKAQDALLYQGPSDIYSRSGTVIKQVQLWQIDTVRVTYAKDGNLSDILTEDVLRIVTKGYEMTFDEQNQVVIKMYDCIILSSGDTLRGFIVNILNDRYLEYMPVNGKRVKETAYKSYVTSRHIKGSGTTSQTVATDNAIQKQPDQGNVQQSKTNRKNYPSAKNNIKNKDVIVTVYGDTILCRILKNKPASIEYSIMRFGHDTRAVIPKSEVSFYNNATEPKSGWKVPVTIVAIIATILAMQIAILSN